MWWVVDLQTSMLKDLLGAKSLPGFNMRLVKYLEENKPCLAQKILRNERGWRWGGGTCRCLALSWTSILTVVGEQVAQWRRVLAGKKGCWYVLILCWNFCCRFWFTSLISTKPSPNWVDWPWLLHSRQLIKGWLISALNGWLFAERLGITSVLPPQTSLAFIAS